MQNIPTLVQDLGIARLTNAVFVGTMKFTVEHVEAFLEGFDAQAPEVALLRLQLADAKAAYQVLNEAYAKTLRSAITDDIAALDTEGDQLYMAVKQTVEGAEKMAFDPARVQAAKAYVELLKKYRIDTKENMISEWSKVQQLCEEADESAALQQAAQTLGIATAMERLTTIAASIRDKITQRSGELPEAQQMKRARSAMEPEYRALVQILNASAIIYQQAGYTELIKTLNGNINYVKIHAMTKGTSSSSSGGGDTPTPSPTPDGGGSDDQGGGGSDDQGGGGSDDQGGGGSDDQGGGGSDDQGGGDTPTPTPDPTPDPSGGGDDYDPNA